MSCAELGVGTVGGHLMAPDPSASGEVIGKKAPYIRPAVPLKWEKKRPITAPSIQQKSRAPTPEPVYDGTNASSSNNLENRPSIVPDRDLPITRKVSEYDETPRSTSDGVGYEKLTIDNEDANDITNQDTKIPSEIFFEESDGTQNIINTEGTAGGIAPDTDTDAFSGITKSTEVTDPSSEPSQNGKDDDVGAGERMVVCSSRAPSPRTPCSELAAGTVQESDDQTPNASSNNISASDELQAARVVPETTVATNAKESPSMVDDPRTSPSPELSSEGTNYSTSAQAASSLPTHQTTPATQDVPESLEGAATAIPGYNSSNLMHPGAAPFFPTAYPGSYYAQTHQTFNPYDQIHNLYPYSQYYSPYYPSYHHYNQIAPDGLVGGQFLPPPSATSLKDGSPVSESDALIKHLLLNFNDSRFSDVVLNINHGNKGFKPLYFHLHRIMMARSAPLIQFADERDGKYGEDNKLHTRLDIYSRFVTPISIETAIRVCYGESILSFVGSNSPDYLEGSKEQMIADMTESIALAVIGNIFQLKNVVLRGLEVAVMRLGWATLEYAVSFGMESCNFRRYTDERSEVPTPNDPQPGFKFTAKSDPDLYPQNAREFLSICLHFIHRHCPSSWRLDDRAKPLSHVDRLPCPPEPRYRGKKSRFAKIKFGQRASHEDEDDLEIRSIISSVVLSLPFEDLSSFLQFNAEHDGPIYRQMEAIVDERERRRKRVFENKSILDWRQPRPARELEWENVGFEESVAKDEDGKMLLERTECSIDGAPADVVMSGEQENVDQGMAGNLHG